MAVTATANMLQIQLDEFISYLKETKKASANTLQAYIRDLNKFAQYISCLGVGSFAEISKNDVNDFKAQLKESGLSSATVSRTLSAVRSMMQYFVSLNVIDHNPAREIHNDKARKNAPVVLSNREIEKLLAQPSGKDYKSIRDKAMLELLYATGIKATELIEMNITDVNLQLSIIKCTKGEKERVIPLYPIAAKSLAEYINTARKMLILDKNEKALFVNVSGERMTRQGLWKILKVYAYEAEIYTDITPHTLRHSFAAHLLENGADIHDIQEILGHSDISSTQRYAQFLKDYHKKSYMKFHPRA